MSRDAVEKLAAEVDNARNHQRVEETEREKLEAHVADLRKAKKALKVSLNSPLCP
jgi:hypothetical protein